MKQLVFSSLLPCTRSTFHLSCHHFISLTMLSIFISGPSDKMSLFLPLMSIPQALVSKPTFLSTTYSCTSCSSDGGKKPNLMKVCTSNRAQLRLSELGSTTHSTPWEVLVAVEGEETVSYVKLWPEDAFLWFCGFVLGMLCSTSSCLNRVVGR